MSEDSGVSVFLLSLGEKGKGLLIFTNAETCKGICITAHLFHDNLKPKYGSNYSVKFI